ncbi:MAG: hypothetical protein CMJ65_02300 [Planctomycetaceae bacterium]|nr:hypothetical protein [Planctomycetaceae bacterium]
MVIDCLIGHQSVFVHRTPTGTREKRVDCLCSLQRSLPCCVMQHVLRTGCQPPSFFFLPTKLT